MRLIQSDSSSLSEDDQLGGPVHSPHLPLARGTRSVASLPVAQNPVEMSWHGRLAIGTAAPGRLGDASRLGGVCCCAGRVLVDEQPQAASDHGPGGSRESRRGRKWGLGARGPHCTVLLGIVLRTRNPGPGAAWGIPGPSGPGRAGPGLPWAESTGRLRSRRELMTRTLGGNLQLTLPVPLCSGRGLQCQVARRGTGRGSNLASLRLRAGRPQPEVDSGPLTPGPAP